MVEKTQRCSSELGIELAPCFIVAAVMQYALLDIISTITLFIWWSKDVPIQINKIYIY